jgi:hypothetical protein
MYTGNASAASLLLPVRIYLLPRSKQCQFKQILSLSLFLSLSSSLPLSLSVSLSPSLSLCQQCQFKQKRDPSTVPDNKYVPFVCDEK